MTGETDAGSVFGRAARSQASIGFLFFAVIISSFSQYPDKILPEIDLFNHKEHKEHKGTEESLNLCVLVSLW